MSTLAESGAPDIVVMVMLLSAAVAVGYYLLLYKNHIGLYVILIANILGILMNRIHVPGYTISVTTGLIPGIITYFVTRKQVAYPLGWRPGQRRGAEGNRRATARNPLDRGRRPAAQPPASANPANRTQPPCPCRPRRHPGVRRRRLLIRARVTPPLAIAGAVVLLVCIISAIALAGATRTRSNDSIAPTARASSEPTIASARVGGKAATPESKAPAVVSPWSRSRRRPARS